MTEIKRSNTLADDLAGIIGFSATLMLCATRGGRKFYVPKAVDHKHVLFELLGESAFTRLVDEFGGQSIDLPALTEFHRLQRIRRCAQLIITGRSERSIAAMTGVSLMQVKNDRCKAELLGLLPMVIRYKCSDESLGAQMMLFE